MKLNKAILDRPLSAPIAFVDSEGKFYEIFPDGTTNFISDVQLEGDTVLHLAESDPEGICRAVEGEYVAWNSMAELKAACEAD